jgi:hypothetical protein
MKIIKGDKSKENIQNNFSEVKNVRITIILVDQIRHILK